MSVQGVEQKVTDSPGDLPSPGQSARGLSAATGISFVLRILGMCVGMVTTSILARFLEPEGYGAFSLALTLGTAAALLADLGIAVTVASRMGREQRFAGQTLSTGLTIRTIMATAAAAGLVAAALAGYFGDSGEVVIIVAIATPLSAASVLSAGAMARFRPQVSSVLALAQGILWLIAVAAVSRIHGDLTTLAWFFVLVTTLQTGIGIALNRRLVKLSKPSFAEAKHILALSWPLAVSGLAFMVCHRINAVVLFDAKGATELGIYSAAYKFVDVAQLGPGLLIASLLPLASASVSWEKPRQRMIFSLAMRVGIAIGVGTAAFLIVLAPVLIKTLYGADYVSATQPLIWLAVGFVGISIRWVGTTICTSAGVVRPIAMITVPVAALSLAAQIWACPRWGATGAAAVSAGTEIVIGIASCIAASRVMNARFPLGQLVLASGAGALAIGCAVLLTLPWWLEALIAAVVLGIALVAVRTITIEDVRRALSKKLV